MAACSLGSPHTSLCNGAIVEKGYVLGSVLLGTDSEQEIPMDQPETEPVCICGLFGGNILTIREFFLFIFENGLHSARIDLPFRLALLFPGSGKRKGG